MAAQGLLGQVVVFHAQGEDGFAVRVRNEGVEVVDVQLGLQQGGHEAAQAGGVDLDHHQLAFGERETLAHQHVARAVGIVHHDTDNGTVGGVHDHQGEDMNAVGAQQADEDMQAAQAVGGEDRELDHRVRAGQPL